VDEFNAVGMPCGPIYSSPSSCRAPQSNGAVTAGIRRQTEKVLAEFGFSADEIAN
jgi:hypothetical protein